MTAIEDQSQRSVGGQFRQPPKMAFAVGKLELGCDRSSFGHLFRFKGQRRASNPGSTEIVAPANFERKPKSKSQRERGRSDALTVFQNHELPIGRVAWGSFRTAGARAFRCILQNVGLSY